MFVGIVVIGLLILYFGVFFYELCLLDNGKIGCFFAQNNVVRGSENVYEFEVLMHHSDFVLVGVFGR